MPHLTYYQQAAAEPFPEAEQLCEKYRHNPAPRSQLKEF